MRVLSVYSSLTSLNKTNVLAFGRREEVYIKYEDKQGISGRWEQVWGAVEILGLKRQENGLSCLSFRLSEWNVLQACGEKPKLRDGCLLVRQWKEDWGISRQRHWRLPTIGDAGDGKSLKAG